MSNFIEHRDCPKCGSKDNLAVYDDHSYCFSPGCEYWQDAEADEPRPKPREKSINRPVTPILSIKEGVPERKILPLSTEKYQVGVGEAGHVYPYFDDDGNHVANKVRQPGPEKGFRWEGDVKQATQLFGQKAFTAGGKAITIVEGELDALACFQITGSRFPCVSVKSASSAKKDVASQLDYLQTFDKVVLAFDSDEPGQKAAKECAALFEPGKVRIMEMRKHKDACDYLVNGDDKAFIDEWFKSPEFKMDGLKTGPNMWSEIIDHKDPKSVPYPFPGFNLFTYGLRTSELVVVNAPTGVGKTSILKELEHSLLMNEDLKAENAGVGFLHFEEPNYDTCIGILGIHLNKRLNLPDTERTEGELRQAYDEVLNTDRVVIWDHFGSNSVDAVVAKIRHMAALGCRYIVLDHLSIVVSDQSGDERKQLDEITTKLKTLCMEKDICVIAVIHQNRNGEIRGTAGVEQLANIVFALHREKDSASEWRRNITKVVVQKNRFCGTAGPCSWLYFDPMTGRLTELKREEIDAYERGEENAPDNLAF